MSPPYGPPTFYDWQAQQQPQQQNPQAPPSDAYQQMLEQYAQQMLPPVSSTPPRMGFADRFANAIAMNPMQGPTSARGAFGKSLLAGAVNGWAGNQIAQRPKMLAPEDRIKAASEAASLLRSHADWLKNQNAAALTPEVKGQNAGKTIVARDAVLSAAGAPVPGVRLPKPTANAADFSTADKILGDEIIAGRTPVTALGNRVTDKNRGVLNYLATQKFDFTKTAIDLNSVRKHFESVNSPTQARLQQAYQKVTDTLPLLHEANARLSQVAPRFTVTPISKLVNTSIQDFGVGGAQARDAATNLYTFATTLQFELAVAYQGGTSPTEETMKKAARIINPDMSPDRIESASKVALREIGINQASINKAGTVSPSNPAGANSASGFTIGNRRIRNVTTGADSARKSVGRYNPTMGRVEMY